MAVKFLFFLHSLTSLTSFCSLLLLQEGIKPMWEDDNNKNGGRWLINLDKKQRMTCLDNFWLEVMLCLIGESFEEDSQMVRTTDSTLTTLPQVFYHLN